MNDCLSKEKITIDRLIAEDDIGWNNNLLIEANKDVGLTLSGFEPFRDVELRWDMI